MDHGGRWEDEYFIVWYSVKSTIFFFWWGGKGAKCEISNLKKKSFLSFIMAYALFFSRGGMGMGMI